MTQFFRKLFQTSDNVAQAMMIRGFLGPERHQLYLMYRQKSYPFVNLIAFLGLIGITALVHYCD